MSEAVASGPQAWPLHPLRDTPLFAQPSAAHPREQEQGGAGSSGLSTFAQNLRQQQSRGMTVRRERARADMRAHLRASSCE